jgi:hypothetical protein
VANADLFDANGQLNTAAKLLYANDLDWASNYRVRRNVDFSYQGKTEEVVFGVRKLNLVKKLQLMIFKRTTVRVNVH